MSEHIISSLLIIVLGAALACGSAQFNPKPIQTRGGARTIIDRSNNEKLTLEQFLTASGSYQVLLVGEIHDSADDHAAEYALLRALHKRNPDIEIAMEMFQRPFQWALDDYIAGKSDQHQLIRDSEYQSRWGYSYAYYKPILSFARARSVRVLAMNAPREWTRAVAYEGLENVPKEMRSKFPELDLGDEAHRQFVMPSLEAHPHGNPTYFYQAQILWEETMAETIARRFSSEQTPTQIVAYAGRMHVEKNLGIARCLARRNIKVATILIEQDDSAQADANFVWLLQ